MNQPWITLAVTLLVAAPGIADEAPATASSEAFENSTAGFAVTKPANWHYLSADPDHKAPGTNELKNPRLQALLAKHASVPLVAFAKYAEPYDDLNPSFTVSIEPISKLNGLEIKDALAATMEAIRRGFKDGHVTQDSTIVELAGREAAYGRFDYTTATSSGRKRPTTSELWILPNGSHYFLLSAVTRQDEKTGSREEIKAIVHSIRITP